MSLLPPQVKPFTFSYCTSVQTPPPWYQLAALQSPSARDLVIDFMLKQLGARKEADWFVLDTHDAVTAVNQRVAQLGGFVYDLPLH